MRDTSLMRQREVCTLSHSQIYYISRQVSAPTCGPQPAPIAASQRVFGLEDLHVGNEGENTLKRHRVAQSDPAPANPCVPLQADQAHFRLGLLGKFALQLLVVVLSYAESDVDA